MFKCEKCGQCCKKLNKSLLYEELHNGDGICIYLQNNLCSIYQNRPLLCRIDESYEILFKDKINKSEYYKLNYKACNELKNKV